MHRLPYRSILLCPHPLNRAAKFCHPREEHLLPLMVVVGAALGALRLSPPPLSPLFPSREAAAAVSLLVGKKLPSPL